MVGSPSNPRVFAVKSVVIVHVLMKILVNIERKPQAQLL